METTTSKALSFRPKVHSGSTLRPFLETDGQEMTPAQRTCIGRSGGKPIGQAASGRCCIRAAMQESTMKRYYNLLQSIATAVHYLVPFLHFSSKNAFPRRRGSMPHRQRLRTTPSKLHPRINEHHPRREIRQR